MWRNLHMFLDILELRIENKKLIFRENCFENVVSDVWKKNVFVSTNGLLEKVQKLKTTKN